MFGNYTCYTPNGASVVDYVLVSENILEQNFFHVSSFVPTLSDSHCKLEWEISANYCVSGELDVPIKTYDISQILFGLMTRQLNFNVLYRQTKFKTVPAGTQTLIQHQTPTLIQR